MQVTKTLIALIIAAGFASAAFAQGTTPTTPATLAAPAAKVTTPAPAASEKKVDALKAAEPAKLEAARGEVHKDDAGKPVNKHANAKVEAKAEVKPEAKPAVFPASK